MAERANLAERVQGLYGQRVTRQFVEWLAADDRELVISCFRGFKPRGDDARPDRGVVPMAPMLFGDDVDHLAIIFGPAKPAVEDRLRNDPVELAATNGLWESVVKLANWCLVDASTFDDYAAVAFLLAPRHPAPQSPEPRDDLPSAVPIRVGEQDIDTLLHVLFSESRSDRVFEGLCNPPGGDWSGLSLRDSADAAIFRWISLPRVSSSGAKRPDHVFVFDRNPW